MEARLVNITSTARNDAPARCLIAIELSKASWVVGVQSPLSHKTSQYRLTGGDWNSLLKLVERIGRQVGRELGRPVEMISCYEAGYDGAGPTTTRDLRRYQEGGADRQLQERWNRLSSQGQSTARERAPLRGQEAWQGRALWRVRYDRQCRLRQRRDHQRHRRVRRAVDPLLAPAHGTPTLSACAGAHHHGGLRRLEWRAGAAVESRTAKARRRDRPRDPRPPLSARHIEMEQDRAPTVLPHHAELAPLTDRLALVKLIDRSHDHQDLPQG